MSKLNCAKCGAGFPKNDPPCLYCAECAERFKEVLRAASARGQAPQSFNAKKDCPVTFFHNGLLACGICGSDRLTANKDKTTAVGTGDFSQCLTCGAVLDFQPK